MLLTPLSRSNNNQVQNSRRDRHNRQTVNAELKIPRSTEVNFPTYTGPVISRYLTFYDSSCQLSRLEIWVNPPKSISRFSTSLRSGRHFETRCGPLTSHITASAPVFQRYTHPTTLSPSVPIKSAIATPSTSSSFTVY